MRDIFATHVEQSLDFPDSWFNTQKKNHENYRFLSIKTHLSSNFYKNGPFTGLRR